MQALRAAAASRIAKQTDGILPEKVDKIVLHGAALSPEMILPFTHLSQLYLVSMKPSLKNLHALLEVHSWSSLILLDVSDNRISISSALQKTVPSLRRLLMANNSIKEMKEVCYLAEAFPQLEVLDLSFNPVSTEENFNDIFNLFPNLVALDSRRRDGEEVVVQDIDESDSESTASGDKEDDEEKESDEDSSHSSDTSCSETDEEEKEVALPMSRSEEKENISTDSLPPPKRMKIE